MTRQMVRAAATFRDLPVVGEAARSGVISFEHITSFTYALSHVGVGETRLIEEPLLEFAKTSRRVSSMRRCGRSVTSPIPMIWTGRG